MLQDRAVRTAHPSRHLLCCGRDVLKRGFEPKNGGDSGAAINQPFGFTAMPAFLNFGSSVERQLRAVQRQGFAYSLPLAQRHGVGRFR